MLKPQIHQSQYLKTLYPLCTPFLHGNCHAFRPIQFTPLKKGPRIRVGLSPSKDIKAIAASTEKSIKVKVVVTVKPPSCTVLSTILVLKLVSADLDPEGRQKKLTIKVYADTREVKKDGYVQFVSDLEIPAEFGEVGAIFVENEAHKEMYLKDIVLHGFPTGPVNITCGSWVDSKNNSKEKRIFFTNKSYLPTQTPNGLKRLRSQELAALRGNGQGERKTNDRIYDYDVYNDLRDPKYDEDPNHNKALARPVLGGKEHPYPRRCRTGGPRFTKDPSSERRSSNVYVPRDEEFSDKKKETFELTTIISELQLFAQIRPSNRFLCFTDIDKLFNEGVNLPKPPKQGLWENIMDKICKFFSHTGDTLLKFKMPEAMKRDKFFWLWDKEFSRETLAGLNPYSLQLVTEWPLKSALDAAEYGPPEPAITKELLEKEMGGFMTVEEAIKQKKLFILDYHDLLMPFVKKVRRIKDTTLYGSRTIFFLNPDCTLRPLVIELTRPPIDGKPKWKEVYRPSWHSIEGWLWRLAKSHVLAHDSGYHQLVSHWLRTHCCTEPYIIATNRQLSAMHPINRLLQPHFRYTMKINALARTTLINADGIIESSFSSGKCSMELSSVAYDKQWRFDYQALPKDLISRGLAVEDPSAPHGLKLTIEDYPFANDGLVLWDAIKEWVSDYVNHYYPNAKHIEFDEELQAWWTEIRTVGHADKKDEPWWPVLKTPQDLIEIITTIAWVTSGHHAAVNFGQYTYAGYFPNRPTIARKNMPTEDPSKEHWKDFLENPEFQLLTTFPSPIQATKVMASLEVLSNHSADEEYIGQYIEPAWSEEPAIKAAFEKFSGKIKELEQIINLRNEDYNLKNRTGAGIVPYELLKPFSDLGLTGEGVPYSISI